MFLEFKPINLEHDLELATAFREDSFLVSYNDGAEFWGVDGKGVSDYQKHIISRVRDFPEGNVHVFLENEIIGQIESTVLKSQSQVGYVNLFYLRAEYRHRGLGRYLDGYITNLFKKMDLAVVRLRVSKTNSKAISFYKSQGWTPKDSKDTQDRDLLFEKNLVSPI